MNHAASHLANREVLQVVIQNIRLLWDGARATLTKEK